MLKTRQTIRLLTAAEELESLHGISGREKQRVEFMLRDGRTKAAEDMLLQAVDNRLQDGSFTAEQAGKLYEMLGVSSPKAAHLRVVA
ncbi:MAG: hypothetical protein ACREGR_00855 [Minisyncoccia bacterium]